jgi:Fe-S oxidoreductase
MCPTYLATHEEIMSTRGRANIIRAVLEGRGLEGKDALRSAELDAALSNCLSCKACTTECPSNVNLALLKAELLHARIRRDGLNLRQRLFCSLDRLGKLGCLMPTLANALTSSFVIRNLFTRALDLAWQRPLPRFANPRFDRWFRRHTPVGSAHRGRVVLWDDTFARYHEPHIGIAATKVLETAGFKVVLPVGRKCCGRPAFSQGHLDQARRLARHNLALLNLDMEGAPIIFLEPSCYSMFVEDYRELAAPGWERIARRCILFERFIDDLLAAEPAALRFRPRSGRVLIHPHCHVKSLMNPAFLRRLALRLPGREVNLLDSSCCGMAGAFGALREKYELSLLLAQPLVQTVRGVPYGTTVVASGTSCRQQLTHLGPIRPRHMAEALAAALETNDD